MSYFEKRHIGDVVSRFGSFQEINGLITSGLISAIIDGVMVLITLIMMLIYSVKITLVVLVVVMIYSLLRWVLYRPLRLLTEELIVANAKEQSNFMESIRAIQTIKLFQRENDRQNMWLNNYSNSLNKGIKVDYWKITFQVCNGLLFGLENVIVIYLAASAVMGNIMSLGMLYAFMSYKDQFVTRIGSLIDQFIQFKMIGLHLDRLADIALTTPENIDQFPDSNVEKHLRGDIVVEGGGFSYSETDDDVFKNINISIKAGESVAIIGKSGCGKTTFLKCLMGFLPLTKGRILIDGKQIEKSPNYRSAIGAIMQEDQLLSGSILENIACFDPEIDIDKVVRCAKDAAIYDEIMQMNMQLNTLVGDMGASLSGGQKQRIILARALYREPKILFLDEATSHLDSENESIVNENIKKLNITRIIVAHREETIKSADRIIDLSLL